MPERGANLVAAFVHDPVGLADDVKRRQARARLHLDRDARRRSRAASPRTRAPTLAPLQRDRREYLLGARGAQSVARGLAQEALAALSLLARIRPSLALACLLAGFLACSDRVAPRRWPRPRRLRRRGAFLDLEAQVKIGPRPAGSAGAEQARALIRERLRQAGLDRRDTGLQRAPGPARPPCR